MNSSAIGVSSIRENAQLQQLNAGNDDMLHGANNTYVTPSDKPSQSLCSPKKSGTLQEKKQVHSNQNAEDDDRKENIPNAKSNEASPKISKKSGQRLKTHFCPECRKGFTLKSNLTAHLRTHSGEKPFKCNICKKEFNQNSNLTTHLRTHDGTKQFLCTMCNKTFTTKNSLTEHVERIHNGTKQFSCTMCIKTFTMIGDLTRHVERKHNGTKQFPCTMCIKTFAIKGDLARHVGRKHNGTKQFPCTMCNKTFALKCDLTRHVKTHKVLIKTNYKCNVCKKVFQQDVLSEHLKSHQEQIVKLPSSPQHS